MRPGFELVDHTADVAIRGHADDLDALFVVMAQGLFAVIAEPQRVQPRLARDVELRAAGAVELLHDWLEELNALHQVHGEIYNRFDVTVQGDGTLLRARVAGERFDPARHGAHLEVKAVTWHQLALNASAAGYTAYVLLDI